MTDNTPTTKQEEGGVAFTPFEKDGFDRHVIALATDYMPRIRHWQAEMRRSFDALKEHARDDRSLDEAAMGTGYVAETLETAGDLIERSLAKIAAPANPPHNEEGLREALIEAVALIRECRLADSAAARDPSKEGRWDRALHDLCAAETRLLTVAQGSARQALGEVG